MWTPKRVLLWLVSLGLFFTGYEVYASFLGGIDGLTPLPEVYHPGQTPLVTGPGPSIRVNVADRKLGQAFGSGSVELQRTIKLDVPNRGLVLAVDDFDIAPAPNNNRVLLIPLSMAIFKSHSPGAFPEITTIRCKKGYLILDQPIKNILEITNRKIVGAELEEDIQIVNNRGTSQSNDDLAMYIPAGTVYYDEHMHRIWTKRDVELIDHQTRPKPTRITATGMDVFLAAEPNEPRPAPAGARKPKGEHIGDVERVELRSNVCMNLWADGRSGFLAPPRADDKPAAAPPPPACGPPAPSPKASIHITTPGKFTFDLVANQAWFDIPPQRSSQFAEIVKVVRENESTPGELDQLHCDHLELQFRRKTTKDTRPVTPPGAGHDDQGAMEIETAHATGKTLTVTSDTEVLAASGNDLFYDARKRQTILKGPDLVVMKDGNEIRARELWMGGADSKDGHESTAIGPGKFSMLDRTLDDKGMERTLKGRWRDKLVYRKDGAYDCLTLIGEASFEDPQHDQKIRADCLKVWLEPVPPGSEAGPNGPKRPRPHHVKAEGRVLARSPDLNVLEPTESLTIWFRDVPAAKELPPVVAENRGSQPVEREVKFPRAEQPKNSEPPTPTPKPPATASKPPEKPKMPIQLSARSVEVHVLRSKTKTDLDRLWCEGAIHVHQEPDSPQDKAMDIQGETLQLNHAADGSLLVVNGLANGPLAQVQFNKVTILGPEVNIDQRNNKAWVDGIGAMQMLTDTNFDGVKLSKPTELTIQWKDSMLFHGKNAEFHGGIQAEQENSRLLCQEMQVGFDRPISLKEGTKGEQAPKVDRLVCDKSVQIEEVTRQGGKLQSYKRLIAPEVSVDNLAKKVIAPGPGEVRIFQLGSADEVFPQQAGPGAAPRGKPAPAKAPPKQEFKITHVRFQERMWAVNSDRRVAVFTGNVDAVNVPSEKPDLQIDIDRPPPGCMYLHCEKLTVLTNRLPDGRANQEMIAEKKVVVQAQEFWGVADVVKYDEIQDRVIFEGGEGSMATLYRVKALGMPQDKITGKKIFYWRKTNEFNVENAGGLTTNQN